LVYRNSFASAFLAALRGIHEGKHFERLVVGNRRLAARDKVYDLADQWNVIDRNIRLCLDAIFVSKDNRAELAIRTIDSHGAKPSVYPSARDDVRRFRCRFRNFGAACAE